jgi:5-methylcytosine-specific restriction endonuclease McrA
MTVAPQTLCNFPGCAELVNKGRCPEHTTLVNSSKRQGRRANGGKTTAEAGYGYSWQQVRLRALARDNWLCQYCLLRDDRVVPAEEVDHRIPFGGNIKSPLRLAMSNLVSTCKASRAFVASTRNIPYRNS